MFFNISKYSIQWLCVIFLLLIQIDVCMPFMDTVSYQVEMCENTNPDESGEQETNDEVFYHIGRKCIKKVVCWMEDKLFLTQKVFLISASIPNDDPVPKVIGSIFHQHILNCVYRI